MGIISLPDKTTRNFFRVLPLQNNNNFPFSYQLSQVSLFQVSNLLKVSYIPISTVPHSPLPFPKHPHHLSLHPSDLGVHFLLLWYQSYLQYLVD